MEYEISIVLNEGELPLSHICRSQTELGLYLELVPSLMDDSATGRATIEVVTRPISIKETHTA